MNVPTPSIILLIGKPKRGKSYFIRYLNYMWAVNRGTFNHVLVFSGSASFTEDFSYVPEDYIHTWDEEVLKNFIEMQKENGYQALLILDDVVGIAKMQTDLFEQIISTHRHLNLTIVISMQRMTKYISTLIRTCAGYAGIFKQDSLNERKSVWSDFCQDLQFKEFENHMNQMAVKHDLLWIDLNCEDLKSKYRKIRAPEKIPLFRLKF